MIDKIVRTAFPPIILYCTVFLSGQTVQINEVMASNQTTVFDEDGDTPDWIELHNPSFS